MQLYIHIHENKENKKTSKKKKRNKIVKSKQENNTKTIKWLIELKYISNYNNLTSQEDRLKKWTKPYRARKMFCWSKSIKTISFQVMHTESHRLYASYYIPTSLHSCIDTGNPTNILPHHLIDMIWYDIILYYIILY